VRRWRAITRGVTLGVGVHVRVAWGVVCLTIVLQPGRTAHGLPWWATGGGEVVLVMVSVSWSTIAGAFVPDFETIARDTKPPRLRTIAKWYAEALGSRMARSWRHVAEGRRPAEAVWSRRKGSRGRGVHVCW
jgi:hypothetical protein